MQRHSGQSLENYSLPQAPHGGPDCRGAHDQSRLPRARVSDRRPDGGIGGLVAGPYVVVARSAGAYVAIRFADQHGGTVAGIVLVDSAIPDQDAVRQRVAPKFAAFGSAAPAAETKRLRQCAADLRSGALKRGTQAKTVAKFAINLPRIVPVKSANVRLLPGCAGCSRRRFCDSNSRHVQICVVQKVTIAKTVQPIAIRREG